MNFLSANYRTKRNNTPSPQTRWNLLLIQRRRKRLFGESRDAEIQRLLNCMMHDCPHFVN